MNKYGKWALLLVASLFLAAATAQAQCKMSKADPAGAKDEQIQKSHSEQKCMHRRCDSLMTLINEAADQLQHESMALAKQAKAKSKAFARKLRRAARRNATNGDGVLIVGDSVLVTILSPTGKQTADKRQIRRVTVNNDSVWVEQIQSVNGKKTITKSAYPKKGNSIMVQGDSVLFDGLKNGNTMGSSCRCGDSLRRQLASLWSDQDSLAQFDVPFDGIAQWSDSLVNAVGRMVDQRAHRFVASDGVKQLTDEFLKAMDELQQHLDNALKPDSLSEE